VRIPLAAAVATDDLWAPPASRDAFFKGYSETAVDRIDLTAAELGVPQVGHMGYFRAPTGVLLWPRMLDWLGQHGLRTTDSAAPQ
jgi:predicted alpha/beta hydrolase